ncbi:unnamed protein product [Brassica oleracea]
MLYIAMKTNYIAVEMFSKRRKFSWKQTLHVFTIFGIN